MDLQTKLQPNLFSFDRFCFKYIEPKKSTPDLENGGLPFTNKNFYFSADMHILYQSKTYCGIAR